MADARLAIRHSFLTSTALLILIALSCGGNPKSSSNNASTSSSDLCACQPSEPASSDYRHDAKHVPLTGGTPTEITTGDVLSWAQDTNLPADTPRTGRELQLFHIAHAYLQVVYLNPGDCDIHIEVSDANSKTAPRFIAETPVDSSYCPARQSLQSQLSAQNIQLPPGGDLPTPIPIELTGMAFEDFEHTRGSAQVVTVWELHPALINILPQ